MVRKSGPGIKTVSRLDDIPKFKSEREESDFWASHELSDDLWNKAEPVPEGILPPTRPRTRPVAIRFDESTLGRLKRLSAHLHKGYQSLLKEFVVERLYEEEKREGLIAAARPQGLPPSDRAHVDEAKHPGPIPSQTEGDAATARSRSRRAPGRRKAGR
jgi:hypothetical protein